MTYSEPITVTGTLKCYIPIPDFSLRYGPQGKESGFINTLQSGENSASLPYKLLNVLYADTACRCDCVRKSGEVNFGLSFNISSLHTNKVRNM